MNNYLSRRRLLHSAAAVAAAPYFVPSTAFGANGKITMGCIGMGGQGKGNMGAFLGFDDVQVVAVCDVDATRAKEGADQVNGRYKNSDCKIYKDFREICARQDIDTMLVATPDHWHALTALAALRNKKDVYCEKPLTHTFEEGRFLINAIKKYDRVWQTGSQQRSDNFFRCGVELVLNGHIGKLQTVEVGLPPGSPGGVKPVQPVPANLDYDLWCGPSPVLPFIPERLHFNWRWVLQYGGGQMMDWINHHNDIAHWGMDMDKSGPVEVAAEGTFPPKDDIHNAAMSYTVRCTYANGVTSSLSSSNRMGAKWIGDKGWVFVDRGRFEASNPQWTKGEWVKRDFDRGPVKAYNSLNHHRNFIDCVKDRKPTICPAETSHRSCTPGHLGMVSILTGRKIKWDPAAEKIIGDDAAQAMLAFKPRDPWKLEA